MTADQPSCSNAKVTKHFDIPNQSSSSNQPKYAQVTKVLATSVTSQSSDSVYVDAKSHTSDVDEYASCDGSENDDTLETSHQDYTTIPISSSLIDTISGINRLINVVRHFSQLLCPNKTRMRYDSLRMSPEHCNEIHDELQQGRVDMAKKLSDVCMNRNIQ